MPLFHKYLSGTLALALLGGCVSGGGEPAPLAEPRVHADAMADTPVRVGAPYSIGGRTYTPVDQIDYDEVGYASWYGAELEGQPTASGEPFRADWVSAAHRTLPLPAYVEVTRLDTGKTILVRINDRGPADPNRLIDLSAAAAEQLGITEAGMAQVRLRRVNPTESERMTLRTGQAAMVRLETPDSLLEILRERAARLPRPAAYASPRAQPVAAPTPAPSSASVPAATGNFIVQVAAFGSRDRAEALARRLGAQVVASGSVFRVRYGPFATEAQAQAAVARARELGQPGAVIQRGQ
ncbi:MAG: septal ring lytic transglycosylase RlpA family protein [Pseudomonadota bacterium]